MEDKEAYLWQRTKELHEFLNQVIQEEYNKFKDKQEEELPQE